MVFNGGFASTGASSNDTNIDNPFLAPTTLNYDAILNDLCSKIEGTSYYSGSSSTWFLRGALGKYEEEGNKSFDASKKDSFSPRGLTDVLLEMILLLEENNNSTREPQQNKHGDERRDEKNTDQHFENCILLAKALAKDSSKYLPAMASSLSHLVAIEAKSSTLLSAAIEESPIALALSPKKIRKRSAIAIPKEFLQLWISAIVDDSTPENLYQQLYEDLFCALGYKLRNSDDPLALPTQVLSYLVHGDNWHCSHDKSKSKSISPPPTRSTLRRASVLLRFLSRSKVLNPNSKQDVALNSGAVEWLLEVLRGKGCPIRHQKQRRETSSGLLDLILEEYRLACCHQSTVPTSMEWLFSPDLFETVLSFFKQTIRELMEDWNRHLLALPLLQDDSSASILPPAILHNRKNCDLVSGENKKSLVCATQYIKFIARLPRKVHPLTIVEEASEGCNKSGKDLLAEMLYRHESPFQRLRLVQLLLDEFANGDLENDSLHVAARKQWFSSHGILTAILEECSKDPFLASSDVTDRFINVYGDPSWKSRFAKKSMLREAPKAISIETFKASGLGGSQTKATTTVPQKTFSPLSRFISQSTDLKRGKLLSKIGVRLFGSNSMQVDQYNIFSDEIHAASGSRMKQSQEYYDILDG